MLSTKQKTKKVPNCCQMVSFDVKSLFTNVPIYWNIQLVLNYPLGPALVDNFMVELENTIVPVLGECLSFWKLYVEDTVFGKNWDHQLHNNDTKF